MEISQCAKEINFCYFIMNGGIVAAGVGSGSFSDAIIRLDQEGT